MLDKIGAMYPRKARILQSPSMNSSIYEIAVFSVYGCEGGGFFERPLARAREIRNVLGRAKRAELERNIKC